MEQILEKMKGCSKDTKFNAKTMYLIRTTKLWWRTRVEDLVASHITDIIETWMEFKEALYAYFVPRNQEWGARDHLRELKHTGKI